jgi:predicted nucleic acid-binding protein
MDDQAQERIRLESEAVRLLIEQCSAGADAWVGSDVLHAEIARNPNEEQRAIVLALLRFADENIAADDRSWETARRYAEQTLGAIDALHLAVALQAECDVLLTTDDAFLQKAGRLRPPAPVPVSNPVNWLMERRHGS